jgi:hypothetical protein
MPSEGSGTHKERPRSARFRKALRQALEEAGALPPAAKARIREDLALQYAYPGEFVAYVDSWKVRNRARNLNREILAHGPSEGAVRAQLARLPREIRDKACVHYVTDPEGPLEVHFDVPGR